MRCTSQSHNPRVRFSLALEQDGTRSGAFAPEDWAGPQPGVIHIAQALQIRKDTKVAREMFAAPSERAAA